MFKARDLFGGGIEHDHGIAGQQGDIRLERRHIEHISRAYFIWISRSRAGRGYQLLCRILDIVILHAAERTRGEEHDRADRKQSKYNNYYRLAPGIFCFLPAVLCGFIRLFLRKESAYELLCVAFLLAIFLCQLAAPRFNLLCRYRKPAQGRVRRRAQSPPLCLC